MTLIGKACIECGSPVPAGMGSRCVKHRGGITDNQRRYRKAMANGTYTTHWRTLRKQALERDGYACTFRFSNCTGRADTVHIRASLGGDHRNATLADCRSACRRCHGVEDAPRAHSGRFGSVHARPLQPPDCN
jgi:5-methylcytosine-specific restriction endonuclease McrA